MALNYLRTILAGDESSLPQDTPSARIDTSGGFPFVGALSISNGLGSFTGTGVALSRDWVLTAGHNADLNDDGALDAGLATSFHLPGAGVFTVTTAITHPDVTGFGVPSVHDDLVLLRLEPPLPEGLAYPTMGALIGGGDAFTMVGFGRSGYGSYGYTTGAGLSVRRFGENMFDTFWFDDEGSGSAEVFRYDFDAPATTGQPGGSLGNTRESLIAPGDSGGPALIRTADGWAVAGINTFTDGFGGQFGDHGGGIVLQPYLPWIHDVTGLPVPEPGPAMLLLAAMVLLASRQRGSNAAN